MSDEQKAQLGAPLPGHRHYVSGFNVMPTNDGEVIIVASTPVAAANAEGVLGVGMMPVVQLAMSWVGCKELALLLQAQVAARESDAGPITSDWIAQRESGLAQE